MRLVYSGNRYSEDLDFNGPNDVTTLRALWDEIVVGLETFGVVAEMRNDWISDVGFSFDISFRGPLYDGHDRSKGKVRIDVNRRLEEVETHRELVTSEYDDVRPFIVTVLTLEHLLAEKVRALLVRGKPRDLYDIWLLLRQGVQPDSNLMERKLGLYEMKWEPSRLKQALERVRSEWERDLQPLLPQFVDYGDAREAITTLLE
jgi:predicted nucleotidyltransferase component of viral defense system